MLKSLKELDVKNKRVIVRVDYNVPIVDGKISSTNRIDESFATIDYLVKNGARVILLSHMGKVKSEEDLEGKSLKIVFDYIKSLDKYDIVFSSTAMGSELDNIVKTLRSGQVVLAENTRFLDLNNKMESGNDIQLAMYWASLADLYVNDAFACMHRSHASVVGIPRFLPSAIGFLVEKELENLASLIDNPQRPFIVLMGGAKLDDKIDVIYTLAEKADYVLLGGGIANTFLSSLGYNIGSSLSSEDSSDKAKMIFQEFKDRIILPKDVITSLTFNEGEVQHKSLDEIGEDDVIGDIGSEAIANYENILKRAKTIFVNGTVGVYEKKQFGNGTLEILNFISKCDSSYKVVGGGDAESAVKKFGLSDKMDFVSTGGGATLKYIADGNLVGLSAIKNSAEKFSE